LLIALLIYCKIEFENGAGEVPQRQSDDPLKVPKVSLAELESQLRQNS
jgi:hypothetical protein